MKYLIRSLKYLVYVLIIFFVCIALVMLFSHQPISAFPEMFKEGSLLPICLIFVAFAAIYPLIGYRKGRLVLDGEWKDYREAVMETMKNAGYRLVEEDQHYAKEDGIFYRNSKVYRIKTDKETGQELTKEMVLDNHSRVMYDDSLIPQDQIRGSADAT